MSAAIRALVVAAGVLFATGAPAADAPIFDAHIHYSQPDWGSLNTDAVLAILARAGVTRAIVSSTPDEGTLRLYEKAPKLVVPFLRPYRTRDDMATWPRDPAIATYLEERLKRGIYRGIGEFHLSLNDVDGPVVRRAFELAAPRKLFLHAHVDAATVEKLLTTYPEGRILWAHAGMSASPATVSGLLDRFPTLWVELALRSDVGPAGALDPAWRELFLRHSDRILVGTDTWVTPRWQDLVGGMDEIRRWLSRLPPDVAEKIAHGNGNRLFPAP